MHERPRFLSLVTVLVVSSVLLLVAAGAQAASLTVISQTRSVSSCAGRVTDPASFTSCFDLADRDSDSQAAGSQAPFDESVSSSIVLGSLASGSAAADQQSTIGAIQIVATGASYTNAAFSDISGDPVSEAESFLEVVFQIATATPYQLSGELGAEADADTRMEFGGPSGIIASAHVYEEPGSQFPGSGVPFAFSGALLPGEYTLTLYTGSCSNEILLLPCPSTGTGSGQFAATLVVPEPSTALLLGLGLGVLARRRLPNAQPSRRGAWTSITS